MERSFTRRTALSVIALLSLSLSAPAFAQYAWIDSNNVRHYSDQPPPASVPSNRILRTPRGMRVQSSSSENTSTPARKTMTLTERNADYQKRKMDQADKDKKAEEAAKQAEVRQKNCERARSYQKSLDNGHRIVRTDKDGQRTFMGDEERARESADVRRSLENC